MSTITYDCCSMKLPYCILSFLVERDIKFLLSFLHLEDIALLMASSKFLRVACLELPVWHTAESQLSEMNGFGHCGACNELVQCDDHVKKCGGEGYSGHKEHWMPSLGRELLSTNCIRQVWPHVYVLHDVRGKSNAILRTGELEQQHLEMHQIL